MGIRNAGDKSDGGHGIRVSPHQSFAGFQSPLTATNYWLSAIGYRLSAIGYRLSAIRRSRPSTWPANYRL